MDSEALNRIGIVMNVFAGFMLAPELIGLDRIRNAETRVEAASHKMLTRISTLQVENSDAPPTWLLVSTFELPLLVLAIAAWLDWGPSLGWLLIGIGITVCMVAAIGLGVLSPVETSTLEVFDVMANEPRVVSQADLGSGFWWVAGMAGAIGAQIGVILELGLIFLILLYGLIIISFVMCILMNFRKSVLVAREIAREDPGYVLFWLGFTLFWPAIAAWFSFVSVLRLVLGACRLALWSLGATQESQEQQNRLEGLVIAAGVLCFIVGNALQFAATF